MCRSPSFLRAKGFRATSITTRSRVVNKRPSNKVYWRYMTADVLRRGVSVSGGIEAVLFFCVRARAGRRIYCRGVWSVGFCPGAGCFPDCGFVTPAHRNCDLVRGFLLLATGRENWPAASLRVFGHSGRAAQDPAHGAVYSAMNFIRGWLFDAGYR